MEEYVDGYGNPEVGEYIKQSSLVEQVPISTNVDSSGFGMYSSGTGTGAINGGGLIPELQYVTTVTAIQTQLPCSPASSEDDGMGGRRKKKGLTKEKIGEKVVHASDAGMTTGTNGNGQQGETHHDKKGLMERIKEKLPGHHHHHQHHHNY